MIHVWLWLWVCGHIIVMSISLLATLRVMVTIFVRHLWDDGAVVALWSQNQSGASRKWAVFWQIDGNHTFTVSSRVCWGREKESTQFERGSSGRGRSPISIGKEKPLDL